MDKFLGSSDKEKNIKEARKKRDTLYTEEQR